ncbi:RNA polymerase ECF family sigma subunit [Stackebrandtia endophytica]|uniref:RNA polymerase ECF family sigma subunit n=1 Tax=Stackebrandtia endophytica TaxID=1496996 RepID=A0A543B0T4_9ACTN|nr:sigma-70 family RNA polymerase sigma factor [Stackebrandtia endophytica]TQL78380.1 RNA polymerase ECF family sigma subunit [Stackebrandtia endophytica]
MRPDDPIEDLLRTEAPQVLGALTRRFGRFTLAEDAVQEALLAAGRRWPTEGIPAEPRSWLIRVGYRRMVDLLRADNARGRREYVVGVDELAMRAPGRAAPTVSTQDDSLTLLVLCCHPCLTPTSRAALTLRAVGGLRTSEIAHAYGVTEATMATRISRAKQRLRDSGARFTPPGAADEEARYASVLQVLYLMFSEGYVVSAGRELGRVDLAAEAIRLTRMLCRERPADAEAAGLLALMLLTEARRDARTGGDGTLIPLEEQERSRWDQGLIAEGTAILDEVWSRGAAGRYRLQAAIAAVHAQAVADGTDWRQIAVLYLWLERLTPTNPVRLSRVVAVARAFGAQRGQALLEQLDTEHGLATDPLVRQRFLAVRGHLHEELDRPDLAARDYREAAALTANEAERRYLLDRAARAV